MKGRGLGYGSVPSLEVAVVEHGLAAGRERPEVALALVDSAGAVLGLRVYGSLELIP